MQKLHVKLENCFGIKSMDEEFDFSTSNTKLIYAKNGSMKTSFTKVFHRFENSDESNIKDEIFEYLPRDIVRKIVVKDTDEFQTINSDFIFTIKSFDESYYKDKDVTNLLLRPDLKERYDTLVFELNEKASSFLNTTLSSCFKYVPTGDSILNGSSADIRIINNLLTEGSLAREIVEVFGGEYVSQKDFYDAIVSVHDNVNDDVDLSTLATEKYNFFFNKKILIEKRFWKNYRSIIQLYLDKLEELTNGSVYFNRRFTHQNAESMLSSLDKLYYFDDDDGSEENAFVFGDSEDKTTREEIRIEIERIHSEIISDPQFSVHLKKLDKVLTGGTKLFKALGEYLTRGSHTGILREISASEDDMQNARKKLILSYFKDNVDMYNEFVNTVNGVRAELQVILNESRDDIDNDWQKAVDEFNIHFSVPFHVYIDTDSKDSMIEDGKPPKLRYAFCKICRDEICQNCLTEHFDDVENKNESSLIGNGDRAILSQGERRAFYLLSIIFEIKQREQRGEPVLFIIDDIADSFDYKNKYAIVSYLQEISENPNFYSIILTHNFDFYRTLSSRLELRREDKFHVLSNNGDIRLMQEEYQSDKGPFETWVNVMDSTNNYYGKSYSKEDANKHILALIPFVRNLIEYGNKKDVQTVGPDISDYQILTRLLHDRGTDTMSITFTELKAIYSVYLEKDNFSDDILPVSVYQCMKEVADGISNTDEKLENKLILAMMIRSMAEKYMTNKMSTLEDWDSVQSLIANKSIGKVFSKFKQYNDLYNTSELSILKRVVVMTPENIHLNSFMYEPILDMDITELKNLYEDVKILLT